MVKRIFLPVFIVLFISIAGTALLAQQPAQPSSGPEKLMLYEGTDWKVQLYGFIKLDLVYNTRDVLHDSGPLWVMNQSMYNAQGTYITGSSPDNNRGSFMYDIRQTRIGLKINGPTILGAATDATIEVDFWGDMPTSGTPSRQGQFRMRHAFVRLKWTSQTYILIGQFWTYMMPWDPFNPSPYSIQSAMPDTVTFIPLAGAGLLFMREPMVAVGQTIGPDLFKIRIEGAIARAQGGNDSGSGIYPGSRSSQTDDIGPGEASQFPAYRARITFALLPSDGIGFTFGGAYCYQRERHQVSGIALTPLATVSPVGHLVNSYCMLGFAKLQISIVSLAGHFYWGTNLDNFFGGVTQGVVVDTTNGLAHSVPTRAGWGELRFNLQRLRIPLVFNFGYGSEVIYNRYWMPRDASFRLWNTNMYANCWIFLHPRFRLGLEYGYLQTKYKNILGVSSDHKYHATFQLLF